MLSGVSVFRHALVAATVVGTGLLAGVGVLAAPDRSESFDQWQTVVRPEGIDGLRITETIDQNFRSNERRGLRREIPNDFGAATDITAESATAPDTMRVRAREYSDTEIRIGDPSTYITGQHRYQLAYTLPEARLSTGRFALDLIGGLDFDTDRFVAVITGLELNHIECFAGGFGETTTCDIDELAVGTYRVEVAPLPAFEGITVAGDIVGRAEIRVPEALPLPEPNPERQNMLYGLVFGGLAALASIPVFFVVRSRGRNEVAGAGAADAAYGGEQGGTGLVARAATRLVTDAELGEMSTIEFAPPRSVQPWEGSVLLRERIDDETVQAYLSTLVGLGGLNIESVDGEKLAISSGDRRAQLSPPEAYFVNRILRAGDPFVTGKYNRSFSTTWKEIRRDLPKRISERHWWRSGGPSGSSERTFSVSSLVGPIIAGLVLFGAGLLTVLSTIGSSLMLSVVVAVIVPAVVAFFAYRRMLPSRSAIGSGLALRVESFRRFLHASEGQHVEWAWKNGLLREYSAWAVALGEADAWNEAMESANLPAPARAQMGPIFIHTYGPSLGSSTTKPAPSGGRGGFGGGGFSGGSVGGGGGGGGGGSW